MNETMTALELQTMLATLMKAKRDGVMDFKETRDVWLRCLKRAGFEVAERVPSVGLRK